MTCVEIKVKAPHAIDWLISTQPVDEALAPGLVDVAHHQAIWSVHLAPQYIANFLRREAEASSSTGDALTRISGQAREQSPDKGRTVGIDGPFGNEPELQRSRTLVRNRPIFRHE